MFQTVGNESMNKAQVRQRKPQNRSVRLKIDVPLLLVTIILAVFGILMVYSASWDYAIRLGEVAHYFISRQLIFLIVGIIVAVILTFFDYHFWRTLAYSPLVLMDSGADFLSSFSKNNDMFRAFIHQCSEIFPR